MNLLLDTCAFIWLALRPKKLSALAVEQINDPSNILFLSDVSVWEICLKHSNGKLPLPDDPRQWLPKQLAFFQVASVALDRSAIYRSGELPKLHSDPFDRLLAAQSIETGLTILSPDMPLSSLGASRLW